MPTVKNSPNRTTSNLSGKHKSMSITQTNAAKVINEAKKESRSINASPMMDKSKASKIAARGKTHSPSGALYKDRSSGQVGRDRSTDKERKNSSNQQINVLNN